MLSLVTIVIYMFFKRFGMVTARENSYRPEDRLPATENVGVDELPLMYHDVDEAFQRSSAPVEPRR